MFYIILGAFAFGVAAARHGLILREGKAILAKSTHLNKATRLRKVFKYLPGLQDTVLRPAMSTKVFHSKICRFPYFLWGCGMGKAL